MDQEELEALLSEWQGVLRLRDWSVRVRFAEADLINGNAHCGTCSTRKMAVIRIADLSALPKDGDADRDPEADLVHELIHLHFDPFAPTDWSTPQGVAMEQAIDLISEALVRLKRAGQTKRRGAR